MRRKVLSLAAAALLCASAPAFACKSTKVMVHDNFATAGPGWGFGNPKLTKVENGALRMSPTQTAVALIMYRGDVYRQLDVCVDITEEGVPGGSAGLVVAWEDAAHYYYFWLDPADQKAGVWRWSYDLRRWFVPVPGKTVAGVNAKPGAKNTLRATITGTHAMAYVNDRLAFEFDVQVPDYGSFVGLASTAADDANPTWAFRNFTITSNEK